MNTHKSPIFSIALTFATGIVLSAFCASPGFWGLVGLATATTLGYIFSRKMVFAWAKQALLVAMGICFLVTGWVIGESSAVIAADDPSAMIGSSLAVNGYVSEEVRPIKSGYRTVFQCESPIVGKVMLYMPKTIAAPHVNDRLSVEMDVEPLSQAHPAYANYLHHQGIHASAKARTITVTGQATGLMPTFATLRGKLAAQMTASFPDFRTAGLSNAMLLGDRSNLDLDLKKDFSATGLSHIIAISGMNFAIIYLVLCFLMKPLLYLKHGRQIRCLIIVPAMIFFALLAGANPAIVRAAIMLSTLDLGTSFWNKSNSLNALSISALLFLAYDPQSLFSPDFQLSYAAVLGILMLQNPILHYFHKRMPWMPKAISSAMAVTLAAQAATTPLVAWHFQSFPTYFLLANLLVLPLVTLVVQIGFVGFLVAWIPGLNAVWGGAMDFLLWVIVTMADLLAQLPGATITALEWAQTGIWVFLGQVILFLAVLEWRFLQRAWAHLRGDAATPVSDMARAGLQLRGLAVPGILIWVLAGFAFA